MNNFRDYIRERWRPILVLLVSLLALTFLYLYKLSTLTHRMLSTQELNEKYNFASLHDIIKNPINAPYKLIDYVVLHFYPHSTGYARLTSVAFALLACALCYIVVYRWHNKRIAFVTTALFGTSGWLLHMGRLATTDVIFVLLPLSLILLISWVNNTPRHGAALFYLTFVAGLAFYTPGAIWFLFVSWFLIRKSILEHLRSSRVWEKVVCSFITIGLAALLAFAIYSDIHILRDWLFIPASIPTLVVILKQWVDTILYLFVRGPYNPSMWLGHAPILDAFTGVMALLGAYFYATHLKNLRTRALLVFFILGSVLVAFNGINAMGYIVPLAYLLAGTGLAYMLHIWFKVFPRNPVARNAGILLLALVSVAAISYHVTSYFVAWRYDPTTLQVFQEKP